MEYCQTVMLLTSSLPGLKHKIATLTARVNIENKISITMSNTIATNIHSDRMISLCWWCCDCSSILLRISTMRPNRSSNFCGSSSSGVDVSLVRGGGYSASKVFVKKLLSIECSWGSWSFRCCSMKNNIRVKKSCSA